MTGKALKEMQRQTGDLDIGSDGRLTHRGLLLRHLVLPNHVPESKAVIDFIAGALSRDAYVNVMAQYFPAYLAHEHPELARPASRNEWLEVVEYARRRGIHRGIPFSSGEGEPGEK